MWKIAVGFAVFAGLALYVISQGGDNIDMTGEKHGAEAVHVPAPAEAPAAPAAAPASKKSRFAGWPNKWGQININFQSAGGKG